MDVGRAPLLIIKNVVSIFRFHHSLTRPMAPGRRPRASRCASVFRSVAAPFRGFQYSEHAPGDLVRHVRGHEPGEAGAARARAFTRALPRAIKRPQTEHLLGRDERTYLRQVPPAARTAAIRSRERFSSIFGRTSGWQAKGRRR